jgi:hypothetical protein
LASSRAAKCRRIASKPARGSRIRALQ